MAYNRRVQVQELIACSPHFSPSANIWHIIKQNIFHRRSWTYEQLELQRLTNSWKKKRGCYRILNMAPYNFFRCVTAIRLHYFFFLLNFLTFPFNHLRYFLCSTVNKICFIWHFQIIAFCFIYILHHTFSQGDRIIELLVFWRL